jgi:hypothetical protein
MAAGEFLDFTFRYTTEDRWVGTDYHIAVISTPIAPRV